MRIGFSHYKPEKTSVVASVSTTTHHRASTSSPSRRLGSISIFTIPRITMCQSQLANAAAYLGCGKKKKKRATVSGQVRRRGKKKREHWSEILKFASRKLARHLFSEPYFSPFLCHLKREHGQSFLRYVSRFIRVCYKTISPWLCSGSYYSTSRPSELIRVI